MLPINIIQYLDYTH